MSAAGGVATTTGRDADDAWERSARFWLRAYPRRWRDERGEELLGVLADLAQPGARRLGHHMAVDLVRSGWATRLREHPPLGPWLLYRGFDRPLPVRWRAWAADDIDGRWYPVRSQPSIGFFLFMGTLQLLWGDLGLARLFLGIAALFLVLSMTVLSAQDRDRARERHLLAFAGEPLRAGLYLYQDAPRPRVGARQGTARAVGVLAVVAGLCGAAALSAPLTLYSVPVRGAGAEWQIVTGPIGEWRGVVVGLLVVALVAGAVVAVVVRRRLSRLLTPPHDQPDRVAIASIRRVDAWTAVLLAAVAALAWAEATGVLVVLWTVALAVGALLLLPGAVVALLVVGRRAEAGPEGDAVLAFADIRRVALAGRPPLVDQPRRIVVPAQGPFPEGAVVPAAPRVEPPWPALPA